MRRQGYMGGTGERTRSQEYLRKSVSVFVALSGVWLAGIGMITVSGESDSESTSASGQPPSIASHGRLTRPLPGVAAFDEKLRRKMEIALAAKGPDYIPRTHHFNPDGSAVFTNRLILETSPYLIQHAHNPVNWYPWGDEAFQTAKELGRPVLLSVGYSTCHWCHVMEEESFDDEEIAQAMNENYIAIKVDREERPDIDAIYMSAVQSLTGRGGWPMTVWLTPERKPFYGGTYFPARDGDRGSRVGFLTLLRRLKKTYDEDPERISTSTSKVTQAVLRAMTSEVGTEIANAAALKSAMEIYRASFDAQLGGLKRAPKFPSSLSIRFLLRYHQRTGDAQALEMATLTLEKMAAGGIHDQVGGGFHRYSTDEGWLVPHFEKMLYDNALLTLAYLEGYQASGREDFAEVARRILRYVERDMTSPGGAFYSATDADSLTPEGHREEGRFFTWTPAEILEAVGARRAPVVLAYYDVTEKGNFENRSILHSPRNFEVVARELGKPEGDVRRIVEEARELLYEARKARQSPIRDEKILTGWNGLMISALAQASLILDEESYARRAERAADFILEHLRDKGRLLRSFQAGQARQNGFLSDHAFLAAALIDLYEATGRVRWLREAMALDEQLATHFEDKESGGFFRTRNDHERLLIREKPSYDGAEPSGNSLAILNLLRLHEFTTRDTYRERAAKALVAFQPALERAPTSLSEMLLALNFHLDRPKEIVIVTPRSPAEAAPMLAELRRTYLPNRILVVASEGGDLNQKVRTVPLLEGKIARDGKTTAYVCEERVCKAPTTDPAVFAEQIRAVSPLPEGKNAG